MATFSPSILYQWSTWIIAAIVVLIVFWIIYSLFGGRKKHHDRRDEEYFRRGRDYRRWDEGCGRQNSNPGIHSRPDGDQRHGIHSRPDGDQRHGIHSRPDGDQRHGIHSRPDGDQRHGIHSRPHTLPPSSTDVIPDFLYKEFEPPVIHHRRRTKRKVYKNQRDDEEIFTGNLDDSDVDSEVEIIEDARKKRKSLERRPTRGEHDDSDFVDTDKFHVYSDPTIEPKIDYTPTLPDEILKATDMIQEKYKHEGECRRILQEHYGVAFPKSYPEWLKNDLKRDKKGRIKYTQMELDGYCESLQMAFEYMGEQHYKEDHCFNKSKKAFDELKYRDKRKVQLCEENGVYLIIIPYHVKFQDLEGYIMYNLPEKVIAREERKKTMNAK